MKSRSPFTLIELIVVMGIIGILAAMLLPTLHQIHLRGQQVTCANNLRQLGTAMMMYGQDFSLHFPPGASQDVYEHGGTNWTWFIYPYYQNVNILDCPTSPDGPPHATREGFHLYDGNYGWNFSATNGSLGPIHARISIPSSAYLIFDSGDPCILFGAHTWENLMEELDLDWNCRQEGPNRHVGETGIIMLDGHVEQRKLDRFLSCPNESDTAPWFIDWKDGTLPARKVPFPNH